MKRITTLIILILLVLPFASASFFDWVTGRVTEGSEPVISKEQVKCVFLNSGSAQECYTDDGNFKCSGTDACLAAISGENGKTFRWKSSCGGEGYTTIDGTDKYVEFKCEQPQPVQPAIPVQEFVKEQVKCVFTNSVSEQKCYGDGTSCSGIGSCVADVSGENGKTLTWKSSCGGYASTVLDGNNDEVAFKCETTQPPTEAPIQNIELVKEQIKCIFANSNSEQKCYSEAGGCSGIGGCVAEVSGEKGTRLTWRTSCVSTVAVSTVIDGTNKGVGFTCYTETPPVPAPLPVQEYIKEQVKCVFINSASNQKCYTDDGRFGCSGIGACVADVAGSLGGKITWKSTCGGYAYTLMDGNNDYAEFKCEQATTPLPTIVVKEQVKCLFTNSNSEQKCYSEAGSCGGIGTCIADVSGEKGKMLTWKSTCGGYAYTVIDENNEYAEFNCQLTSSKIEIPTLEVPIEQPITPTQTCTDSDGINYFFKGYVESNGMKNYDTCRVINSNTDYYDTSECSGANCYVLEASCTESKTAQAYVWKCPDVCKEGACVGGEVKEQVRCIFADPELIQRCYADMGKLGCQNIVRKCYTDDSKFECSDITVASTPLEGGGFKYVPFCVANVAGSLGAKLTWKSSCGGYAYTVIDGNNEDVEFNCAPSSDVTIEQISGKGFLHAYWQCYDGAEEKSIEGVDMTTCKSSEIWQEYAKKSCENRCYPDRSKCGVNSFSVSGECYINVEKEGVFISPVEMEKIKERIEEIKEKPREEKKEEKPEIICKDSCPLDGKCYPFGYRKEGKYCYDEGSFKEQLKEDEACDNNFECKTNVCINGNCISSGFIQKVMNWFKRLFPGREETKEETTQIVDCGASNECMENAFKVCKPAKMSQQGGPVSEIVIVGLEDEKCVLKMAAGTESMTCKFENYALGTKNMGPGPIEQYCSGTLTYRLAAAPKMIRAGEAPVLNSVVVATKLSADPNDLRYSFNIHDPDGISEFRIIKSDFGEVSLKAEPPCVKDFFISERKFNPSDLPLKARVEDCGTPVIRHELKVDIQIPVVEKKIE